MSKGNLMHCAYCSASTKTPLSSTELESLLAECRRNNSYVELGEGRAKSLLAAFKDGKWRASLSAM